MDTNQRHPNPASRPGRTNKNKNKIVFSIFILIIILFIAKKEIPLVSDIFDQLVAPEQTQASKTCQQQSVQLSQNPAFARIVQPGQVTETQQGFLVSEILVGEMGNDGHETYFKVTCYTDSKGQPVRAEIVNEK